MFALTIIFTVVTTVRFWTMINKELSTKPKTYFTDRLYILDDNTQSSIKPLNQSHAAFYFDELELDPTVPFTKEMVNASYNRLLSYHEEYLALGEEPSFEISIKSAARDYLLNYYDYAAFLN